MVLTIVIITIIYLYFDKLLFINPILQLKEAKKNECTQDSKLIRTVNIYIIYMDMLHLNNYVNIETVVSSIV